MKQTVKRIVGVAMMLTALFCAVGTKAQGVKLEVNQDTLMKHVIELSSERYHGRLAGTDGYTAAERYVIKVLKSYGLEPAGDGGSWFQEGFTVECNEVENCTFRVYQPGSKERKTYSLGKDYSCAGMTGRGYVDAEVVFVGYGLDCAALDEYSNVDAQGKIVMCVSGVPNWLPSSVTDAYATARDKARVAKRHGAVGLVMVNMSKTAADWEVQNRVYSGELPHLATFPMVQPCRYFADELLRGESLTLDEAMARLQEDHQTHSFALKKRFEIEVNATYRPKVGCRNIVARLKGTSKQVRREEIMIGASLDGDGQQGDTYMYPGADDNASAVAAVLETMRVLSQLDIRERPKRSVLVVFFGGKELGYLGSQYFVRHYKKQERIEAMLALECVGSGDSLDVRGNLKSPRLWDIAISQDSLWTKSVGRSKKTIKVYATEQELFEREKAKKQAEKEAAKDPKKLKALKKQKPTGNEKFSEQVVEGFQTEPSGDAKAMALLGVPSLTITTFGGQQHSHVPSDTPENINREMLHKAATLTAHTVLELAKGMYRGRTYESKLQEYGPWTYEE